MFKLYNLNIQLYKAKNIINFLKIEKLKRKRLKVEINMKCNRKLIQAVKIKRQKIYLICFRKQMKTKVTRDSLSVESSNETILLLINIKNFQKHNIMLS